MMLTRVDATKTLEPMNARTARIVRQQIRDYGYAKARVIHGGEPYHAKVWELRKCRGEFRWEATTQDGLTYECDGMFWA